MIDAKDLRLGNLIKVKSDGEIVSVSRIHPAEIMVNIDTKFLKADFVACDLSDLEPVPLSPEILVEWCGFEKQDSEKIHVLGGGDIYVKHPFHYHVPQKDDTILSFVEEFPTLYFGEYPLNDIQYLHQLQNAYYFLLGAELSINLPAKV
jgi:hypothetical protein